jgi:predicted  nucleic acid-binding Zn-ribbon protein
MTKMYKSDNKFGISDAMLEAAKAILDEKLVGKQHKIDANHNGKIDAQDFKLLKGKKKMMEGKCPKCGMDPCECEHVKEEKMEGSARDNKEDKKLAKKHGMTHAEFEKSEMDKKHDKKNMKEDVKHIDELSKETLRSYAQKALKKGDMAARMSNNGTQKDMSDIANKRREGVSKAINKMAEDVSFTAEEIARIEAIAKDME